METSRLALPLLAPGQAQKEMTHNEALFRIDVTIGASVASADMATPPADPSAGDCWIVAVGAIGAWAGRDGNLAGWTPGGWRFVAPRCGLHVWVEDRGCFARHDGTEWRIGDLAGERLVLDGLAMLGPRLPAIIAPVGGAVVDAEARTVLAAVLSALQHHGLTEASEA